jgi:hypothetical protein
MEALGDRLVDYKLRMKALKSFKVMDINERL